ASDKVCVHFHHISYDPREVKSPKRARHSRGALIRQCVCCQFRMVSSKTTSNMPRLYRILRLKCCSSVGDPRAPKSFSRHERSLASNSRVFDGERHNLLSQTSISTPGRTHSQTNETTAGRTKK